MTNLAILERFSKLVISTTWVFHNKLYENRNVLKNKTRTIMKKYNQKENIYFNETYAPVIRLEGIRMLLEFS